MTDTENDQLRGMRRKLDQLWEDVRGDGTRENPGMKAELRHLSAEMTPLVQMNKAQTWCMKAVAGAAILTLVGLLVKWLVLR